MPGHLHEPDALPQRLDVRVRQRRHRHDDRHDEKWRGPPPRCRRGTGCGARTKMPSSRLREGRSRRQGEAGQTDETRTRWLAVAHGGAARGGAARRRAARRSLADLRQVWKQPSADARPMMRWWWFGAAVTPEGLDHELQAMQGSTASAASRCSRSIRWSPTIAAAAGQSSVPVAAVPRRRAHSAATARRLGLRFDLTLGSGWPYGGPHPDRPRRRPPALEKVAVKGRRCRCRR